MIVEQLCIKRRRFNYFERSKMMKIRFHSSFSAVILTSFVVTTEEEEARFGLHHSSPYLSQLWTVVSLLTSIHACLFLNNDQFVTDKYSELPITHTHTHTYSTISFFIIYINESERVREGGNMNGCQFIKRMIIQLAANGSL